MSANTLPYPPRVDPSTIAIFLDVDGTLLEIAPTPEAVVVPDELPGILDQLDQATGGAIAVVSGRSLAQLDEIFQPVTLSAAGLHGLERRNRGAGLERGVEKPAIHDAAKVRLEAFAAEHPGTIVEDKGITLALHYRGAPDAREAASALVHQILEESRNTLTLLDGKMVFELKPPGFDKGKSVEVFLQEPPYAGRMPVFAGDDVTDEAGFKVTNALNGVTVRIGGNSDRDTAAKYAVDSVSELRVWLKSLMAG